MSDAAPPDGFGSPASSNDASRNPADGGVARTWFDWRLFVPKSFTVLVQEGYRFADFRADAVAGLTVA
ncbi:MAG: hypothetical protein EON61_00695, partial [Alphaproteobacteria bacterium]